MNSLHKIRANHYLSNGINSIFFFLRNSDEINREFLARINHSGKLHMTPAMVRGKYTIRFCVTYEHATEEHIG